MPQASGLEIWIDFGRISNGNADKRVLARMSLKETFLRKSKLIEWPRKPLECVLISFYWLASWNLLLFLSAFFLVFAVLFQQCSILFRFYIWQNKHSTSYLNNVLFDNIQYWRYSLVYNKDLIWLKSTIQNLIILQKHDAFYNFTINTKIFVINWWSVSVQARP